MEQKVMKNLFTSESVSEGHPDKLCDQISDAILDACLEQDPMSRVACETFTTTETVVIGGEITTKADVNYEAIARETLRKVGYTHADLGIGADTCDVIVKIHEQSADIAMGVDDSEDTHEIGAGDQGIMFGYATDETETYMPVTISMSHELVRIATYLRKSGFFIGARPDMKSQVTMDFTDKENPRVDTMLMSIQHDPNIDMDAFKSYVKEHVMDKVAIAHGLNTDYRVLINPTGNFVIGGPHGDAGLTGRKIIVDTYGGAARHGGGAFSGKDLTKVDRSAAYMCRYIAKNIVAAGIAKRLEIQVSYAIGVSKPVSISVNHFGTTIDKEKFSRLEIVKIIEEHFDLTPGGIINHLDLRRPIYSDVAAYGHFGRADLNLPWERLDKVEELKKLI